MHACMHKCVCMHTGMCVHINIHACIHACVHMYACTNLRACTYAQICMYVCTYINAPICTRAGTYVPLSTSTKQMQSLFILMQSKQKTVCCYINNTAYSINFFLMSDLEMKKLTCAFFVFTLQIFISKGKYDTHMDRISCISYCIECDRLSVTVLFTPGTALNATDCL